MQTKIKNNQSGFTLIELLVVIMIIGMMASIVIYAANTQRKKGLSARRIADMNQVRKALEIYYQDNGTYPVTSVISNYWYTECNHGLGVGGSWNINLPADQVIPGLAPNYINHVPSDPSMDKTNCTSFYAYASSGTDYKLVDYSLDGYSNSDYSTFPDFIDPVSAVGSPNSCGNSSTTITAFAVYSPGFKCRAVPGNAPHL